MWFADVDGKKILRFYAGSACAATIPNVVSLRKSTPMPIRKSEWQWPINSTQAVARPAAATRI